MPAPIFGFPGLFTLFFSNFENSLIDFELKEGHSISKEYTILHRGNFMRNDLKITYTPIIATDYPETIKLVIEKSWMDLLKIARQKENLLFNGSLCHLKAYSFAEGTLHLQLCLTDYKNYACTRNTEFSEKFPHQERAIPLAVCIALISSDNKILVEKRNGVDTNNGMYHVFGGFVDPESDCNLSGIPDVFLAIQRELQEETGLKIDTNEIKLLGLVKDLKQPHYELCFSHVLTKSATELIQIIEQNAHDGEIGDLYAIDVNDLTNGAALCKYIFTPTGKACIELALRF